MAIKRAKAVPIAFLPTGIVRLKARARMGAAAVKTTKPLTSNALPRPIDEAACESGNHVFRILKRAAA